jgi:diguanylate cyclase (GGDEF)-like protein
VASPVHDPGSGLLNGHYFTAALPNRVATARRVLRPLSLVLLDAADSSDEVVHALTYAFHDTLRESDTACRLADGRFALILEDTPEDGAVWTVERVRRLLSDQQHDVVLWAGVAAYPAHALDHDVLLSLTEAALADAKAWGASSRIEVAPAPTA